MSNTRNLADLLDSSGDIKSAALDNVTPTTSASDLTSGTLAAARIANNTIDSAHITAGAVDDAHISGLAATKLTGTIADARFPSTLPAISGANLTNLPASGATHTSSGSAPSSPSIGDFWHDTTNDRLYIRTNDGSSNIWLQI